MLVLPRDTKTVQILIAFKPHEYESLLLHDLHMSVLWLTLCYPFIQRQMVQFFHQERTQMWASGFSVLHLVILESISLVSTEGGPCRAVFSHVCPQLSFGYLQNVSPTRC